MPRPSRAEAERPFAAVLRIVRAIPRGRVMTYGQISDLLDRRISAQAVGWALRGCPADVPWQRVVNARGGFPIDRIAEAPGEQRARLLAEGVTLRADGSVDLERCRHARPRA